MTTAAMIARPIPPHFNVGTSHVGMDVAIEVLVGRKAPAKRQMPKEVLVLVSAAVRPRMNCST
jgi:hypothetical protein